MATQNGWNNKISTGSAITLNCGTNSLNISSDASAGAVNLATGAAPKVVTLGSTNAASSLALQYGTADFSLASATGNVMVALDSGEITKPLQPSFSAVLTTDNNVTGNNTQYQLGTNTDFTEIYDQGGDFVHTNGVFTAPVTGRYLFSAGVRLIHFTGATEGILFMSTSNRNYYISREVPVSSGGYFTCSGAVYADLDAGDTAYVRIQVGGLGADTASLSGDTTNGFNWFQGTLIV